MKLFHDSYRAARRGAKGASPKQMREYSQWLEIPDKKHIMLYYTHKTGRSRKQTVDNVHYATPVQKKAIKDNVEAAVRYIQGKRTAKEIRADWALAYRLASELRAPNLKTMLQAIEDRDAEGLQALTAASLLNYTSLSAKRREALHRLRKAAVRLKKTDMLSETRSICSDAKYSYNAEVICTKDYSRMALAFHNNFFPKKSKPTRIRLAFVPEWDTTLVAFEPYGNVTFGLGVDYAGEVKKGCMRAAQHLFTESGRGLGVHMGSKAFGSKGALFAGLSGTGKTTVSLYQHSGTMRKVRFKQDDMLFITWAGEAIGMENQFYVKTDSITQKYEKPLLHAVMTDSDTMVENVPVTKGVLDFDDLAFCPNGRAFVKRDEIPGTARGPDVKRVTNVFFLTRGDFPALQKVEGDQAASFFALGESVKRAGTEVGVTKEQAVRTVGFDPFTITGYQSDRVEAMRQWIRKNAHATFVILNTGSVGKKKVRPKDTFRMIEAVLNNNVRWHKNADTRTLVGEWPGFDPYSLHPKGAYGPFCKRFNASRRRYLKNAFPTQKWLWKWLE